MAQAIASPEDLEKFASELKQFNGQLTQSMTRLNAQFQRVGEGEFKKVAFHHENREMQALSASFNSMVENIDQLMVRMAKNEVEKTNARFIALQAQINPHFLYNTLETIRSLALRNDPEKFTGTFLTLMRGWKQKKGEVLEVTKNTIINLPPSQDVPFLQIDPAGMAERVAHLPIKAGRATRQGGRPGRAAGGRGAPAARGGGPRGGARPRPRGAAARGGRCDF